MGILFEKVPQVGYPIIFDTFYKSMKMKRFHVSLLVGILLVGSTLALSMNKVEDENVAEKVPFSATESTVQSAEIQPVPGSDKRPIKRPLLAIFVPIAFLIPLLLFVYKNHSQMCLYFAQYYGHRYPGSLTSSTGKYHRTGSYEQSLI